MRPIIGITQDIELKESGGFRAYLDRNYAEAVYRFGGMPLMIPILEDAGAVAEFTGRIDGLLLSGGDDIHPRYYGEDLSDKSEVSPDRRTDYEFALLKEMLAFDKPVLGICLGVQAMNVYFGGKLHQDIGGHREKGADVYHEVKVEGGMLADIVGAGMMRVNSFHHQAIKTVGDGLYASAVSPDGIVEALEVPGKRFAIGVQWHPERMHGDENATKLFQAFIQACKK